tara:strand:+ start:7643 stop:8983 length:1341 start_codon:yes stop_codon:yes gene_type:complete
MDIQDIPEEVYQEKYLKYKKKYLELLQEAGAETASAAQDLQAKKEELKIEWRSAKQNFLTNLLPNMIKDLNEEQQQRVRSALLPIFGIGQGLTGDIVDPIAGNPNDTAEDTTSAISKISGDLALIRLPDIVMDHYYGKDRKKKVTIGTPPEGFKLDDKKHKLHPKVYTADKMGATVVNTVIHYIIHELWSTYEKNVGKDFKSNGATKEFKKQVAEGDRAVIPIINAQNDLDATCESLNLRKGFAHCKQGNIDSKNERIYKFKEKYMKIKLKLAEISSKIKVMDKEWLTVQQEFNTVAEKRTTWLRTNIADKVGIKLEEIDGKTPENMKTAITKNTNPIPHLANLSKKAWDENHDLVEKVMFGIVCKDEGIKPSSCTPEGIIATLIEEFKKGADIDVDIKAKEESKNYWIGYQKEVDSNIANGITKVELPESMKPTAAAAPAAEESL